MFGQLFGNLMVPLYSDYPKPCMHVRGAAVWTDLAARRMEASMEPIRRIEESLLITIIERSAREEGTTCNARVMGADPLARSNVSARRSAL